MQEMGLILGLRRSPGERNGNLLQYPCLEKSKVREAWQATAQGVARGWTLDTPEHSTAAYSRAEHTVAGFAIYLSTDLNCFQFSAITNKATTSICVQVFVLT